DSPAVDQPIVSQTRSRWSSFNAYHSLFSTRIRSPGCGMDVVMETSILGQAVRFGPFRVLSELENLGFARHRPPAGTTTWPVREAGDGSSPRSEIRKNGRTSQQRFS